MEVQGSNPLTRAVLSYLHPAMRLVIALYEKLYKYVTLILNYRVTLSLFYKERSKIMYSHQFWVLYSRSLIWTLVFVQSFLISKSLNSRNFKVKKILLRYLLVNMFSRGNDFIYLFFLRLIPNWNNAISSHATFEDVNIHSKY